MRIFEIIRTIVFCLPLGLFATLGLFLLITIQMKVRNVDIIFRRLMALYCLSGAVSSLLFLFYHYLPDFFVKLDVLYSISVIITMVFLYHFLCFAIKTDKPFSLLHYLIPFFFCTIIFIVKQSFDTFWTREGYSLLFIGTLLFSILYSLLPLYKMHSYYLKLALATNTTKVFTKNLTLPFILEIILYPVTFVVLPFVARQYHEIIFSVLTMLCILLALRMNIPLTYAIIRHYTSPLNDISLFAPPVPEVDTDFAMNLKEGIPEIKLVSPQANDEPTKYVNRKYVRRNHMEGGLVEIDKKVFETYFFKHKPYLNPNFRISDLIDPLQSNRTYISKFINRTYKMNFSSYVNHCRLREMERLLQLPMNKGKKMSEIIVQAGFSNYRNYLRAKKQFSMDTKKTNG